MTQSPGATQHFRASPSAGGLYPAELYVATHGVPGAPDGIHDYLPREHALALCWEGDFRAELARYAFAHPAMSRARAVLILTAVFERSAWRYRDRAYRRILLDSGHVMGNAVLAALPDGLAVAPVADFIDDGVDGLLLLDPARESPCSSRPCSKGSRRRPRARRAVPACDATRRRPRKASGSARCTTHRGSRPTKRPNRTSRRGNRRRAARPSRSRLRP